MCFERLWFYIIILLSNNLLVAQELSGTLVKCIGYPDFPDNVVIYYTEEFIPMECKVIVGSKETVEISKDYIYQESDVLGVGLSEILWGKEFETPLPVAYDAVPILDLFSNKLSSEQLVISNTELDNTLKKASLFLEILPTEQEKMPSKYFAGLNASLDNPVGFQFGIKNVMNNTSAYLSVGIGSTIFSVDYDQGRKYAESKLEADAKAEGYHYKLDDSEYEIASYMITIGLIMDLYKGFGLHYGLGYGRYERSYELHKYKPTQPVGTEKIGSIIIGDDTNNITSVALEYGLNYSYDRFIFMLGSTNIGFSRFPTKLSVSYNF